MKEFLIRDRNAEGKPYTEFVNRFMKMNCAVDLLRMKMFPNAKEITETLGAYTACGHLPEVFNRINTEVQCVVVGDGHRPRTGATIAHLTRWNITSVDPQVVQTVWPIQRFTCYKNRIEELKLSYEAPTIIIGVHSHAKLSECLKSIKTTKDLWIINMPCCVPSNIDTTLHIRYRESRIWSPKNHIEIYKIQ